ncbi:MAG: DNA polymerase III subunit epsilon [Hyphomicrobium sp.]|nr:DNA polymerase III subunit epsilon [Hyphomicrobium sp.]
MREIVLDTETTGLDPAKGHRLIEIGCIELMNRNPTGREFHCFINPERDVPAEAEAVHGLSTAFVADKPLFLSIAAGFLEFIGDDQLVIHNAPFDVGFLNAELARISRPPIEMVRVVDTLALARRKHPGAPNTLDALCKRYAIDTSSRTKHGALVDSLLLAKVYVELLGERQATLSLAASTTTVGTMAGGTGRNRKALQRATPLAPRLTPADAARHAEFVKTLGSSALWLRYLDQDPAKSDQNRN